MNLTVHPVATPLRERRLQPAHFAFMRAVVQGVEPAAAWNRYLRVEGGPSDPRAIRATLAWIRDEFAAAAQRHARFGVARLVRLDTARLAPAPEVRLPSLEDFAADRGLLDFSEAEQLDAYEAEFRPILRRARRRQRLVERQLDALAWLESLVGRAAQAPAQRGTLRAPQAGDDVARWIAPALARPLQQAGLGTLGQLIDRINGIGRRWHGSIRGVGPVKADRILAWLRDHESSLSASGAARLGAHLDRPRSRLSASDLATVPPAPTAIQPLEKLVLPPALDGSHGLHRAPADQCLLTARNDREALCAWLTAKAPSAQPSGDAAEPGGTAHAREGEVTSPLTHTQRSYRKEAERLLLWAVVERGKPLSSLDADDRQAYLAFLADPQPRQRWCAARSRQRWSPLWRPFEGPLGPAAQAQAWRILRSLFNFLAQQRYLQQHPWATAVPRPVDRQTAGQVRGFDPRQWRFIEERLGELPGTVLNLRLSLALRLMYTAGLRPSEALAVRGGDLVPPSPGAGGPETHPRGWLLRLADRQGRYRTAAVPADVIALASTCLSAQGRPSDLRHAANYGTCLLQPAEEGLPPGLRARHRPRPTDDGPRPPPGLSPNALYRQLKRFFGHCADVLIQQGDLQGQWLRHAQAPQALQALQALQAPQARQARQVRQVRLPRQARTAGAPPLPARP
jgi:integrase